MSEQKGRWGLSFHGVVRAQVGHRPAAEGRGSAGIVRASYSPGAKAVNAAIFQTVPANVSVDTPGGARIEWAVFVHFLATVSRANVTDIIHGKEPVTHE